MMTKRKLRILSGIIFLAQLASAQIVNIPDNNFKNALLTGPNSGIDTNNDGQIQLSEAQNYTDPIDVTSKNISDLTGIEAFINIPILSCAGNNLTRLNLRHNVQLEGLFCMNNQIKDLFLQYHPKLTMLYSYNNRLKRLKVSNGNNTNLTVFNTINNPDLKCIQVDPGFNPPSSWSKDAGANYSSQCNYTMDTALPDKGFALSPIGNKGSTITQILTIPDVNFKNALLNNTPVIDTNNDGEIQVSEANAYGPYLNVSNKNISDLTGIEAFINLTTLACGNNNLTKLNVRYNTKLEFLACVYTQIETLSLKYNTKLEILYCWNNNLKRLDLANGHNSVLTNFDATTNPNLSCIQIDRGHTPGAMWFKDSTASFNGMCNYTIDSALPDKGVFTPKSHEATSTINK